MSKIHLHAGHTLDDDNTAYAPILGGLANTSTSQTPTVTTSITATFTGGYLDGIIGATFQGYDPDVTGALTLAAGQNAYTLPGTVAAAAPLAGVLANTPVVHPTTLLDLNFATPAHGIDNGVHVDLGLAATTSGFSGILGPLTKALAKTTLGQELKPIVNLAGAVLPGLDANGGKPSGGDKHAQPWFEGNVGIGLGNTTTILGHSTTTQSQGSADINSAIANAVVATANDGAALLNDGNTLVTDVVQGNIVGAVAAGIATLGQAGVVGSDIGTVLRDAQHQGNPTLTPVADPTLSLALNLSDSQSLALGLPDPVGLGEQLHLNITADDFGAYALGKELAVILPQVISDLSGTLSPTQVFTELANGVSALTQEAANGFSGGKGTSVPSSDGKPDISITASLVTSETQDNLLGSVTNTQTFSLGFDANAQGFYDLAPALEPLLTDVVVGVLQTEGGQEALQIGGDILQQLDSKLSFGKASYDPLTAMQHNVPVHLV